MIFKIISEKSDWENKINTLDISEIFYTFEYCKAAEKIEKGEAKLAIFENKSGEIVYPFILRRINSHDMNSNIFDIVTPYGYGGPYIKGEVANNIRIFRKFFEIYCQEQNIVTEVIRFHPLLNNHIPMQHCMDLAYIRKTTAVNLENDIDFIRTKYSTMNKRNIKKARKNGVFCVAVEKNEVNINIFIELYSETMKRNNALEFYYFNNEIIADMLKDTNNSSSHLLFAFYEGRVVSAVILYHCGEISHYHLGASKTQYLHLKSNNILFDFMICYSKQKNAKIIHLGGGYSENDGLFSFKSSFSNNNHFEYFLGKKILNDEIYEKLNENLSENNNLNGAYFPRYRALT